MARNEDGGTASDYLGKAAKLVVRKLEVDARREKTEKDKERKARESRLMRLGVVAEQVMLRGDLSFIARFESAARGCFADAKKAKRDRSVLGLDSDESFFDYCRAKALETTASAEPVHAGASAAAPLRGVSSSVPAVAPLGGALPPAAGAATASA